MVRRGFTLIELIAVTSIVAIIAAVSIPALSRIPRIRQAAVATELVADLSYAREFAMTTGGRVWVEFNQSRHLRRADGNDGAGRATEGVGDHGPRDGQELCRRAGRFVA